jgi:hypothetical protein
LGLRPSILPYSAECVEGKFSEVGLRSSKKLGLRLREALPLLSRLLLWCLRKGTTRSRGLEARSWMGACRNEEQARRTSVEGRPSHISHRKER